ncbi:MAG: HAMP domain-containing protein [Granulosicoccus sp.]|nr:HAMP domain-containing protein [Granulosicoccus sp.]
MRLKYQMFLMLLMISALIIVLMFAMNSWSFSRGFLGYVNSAEQQRLLPIVSAVAQRYEQEGNWDWVRQDKREFRRLLDAQLSNRPSRRNGRKPDASGARPDRRQKPKPGDSRPPEPPPGDLLGRPGAGFVPRLLLADAEQELLAGRSRRNAAVKWQPVEVDGAVVGYLGSIPRTRISNQLDQLFEAQQRKSFGYAALVMLLVSAALAAPLAWLVVRPLLRINAAVDQISQGNYDHRVTLKRRDEFGDLARNINHLGDSLEKNLDARQRWLAEISHELRTPVAILQGELEALQDGVRKADAQTLGSLRSEAVRLGRLIDDLHDLTLSDIGALSYRMEPLDLVDSLQSVLDAHIASIEAIPLRLRLTLSQPSVRINGDAQRVEQLFANLMQNTLRYTDSEGQLHISVNVLQNRVEVVWEDSSPGVDDRQLPHLFDTLYRTESSRNRTTGGAGLGLAIVKKIAQAHQGHVKAEHSQLGGLKLTFTFPELSGMEA